jgi:hypothetical protein
MGFPKRYEVVISLNAGDFCERKYIVTCIDAITAARQAGEKWIKEFDGDSPETIKVRPFYGEII